MIIYFCIYTFLGYLMESCYVSLLQRKWISSGLLKGPFIPLYGVGAICILYLQQYIYMNIFFTCLIHGFMMTLIEYLTSIYIEKVFHTQCWDYSHLPFHFQGRICLFYTIIWCLLSGLFIYYIHPFILKLHLINDLITIIALIYLAFLLKAFINRLQFSKKTGLDISLKN